MNQVEQATHNIRERMTLRDRAKLAGTAVVAGVLAVGLMTPSGEAQPTPSPTKTEATTPETTVEMPSITLQAPETTVITTEIVETPVTVAPEVVSIDEAAPIIDEDGSVVPVLIEPAVITAETQPTATTEQGEQEQQVDAVPASTVLDSGAFVAVGGALPAPTALEQTTLFDNGGIAEAIDDSGAVVATATAAVPGS